MHLLGLLTGNEGGITYSSKGNFQSSCTRKSSGSIDDFFLYNFIEGTPLLPPLVYIFQYFSEIPELLGQLTRAELHTNG